MLEFSYTLSSGLNSFNGFYRFEEINQLQRIGNAKVILNFLRYNEDIYLKTQAAYLLGNLKYKLAAPYLIEALLNEHWELRYYSLLSLSKIETSVKDKEKIISYLKEEEDLYILELLDKYFISESIKTSDAKD